MLLTGECGCGKTLISRVFYNELRKQPHRYKLVLIDNPHLNHLELLNEILHQLNGHQKIDDKGLLLQKLNEEIRKNHQNNRKVVVIVDEAQQIQSKSTLEEIRLLMNHHQSNDYMLTVILIGQPEFQEIVRKFPQLNQRIAVRHHLKPFSFNEVLHFVDERLRKAGAKTVIFDENAVKLIYDASRGVPRLIINFCDQCLLAAMSKKLNVVNSELATITIKRSEILL